MDLFKEIEEYLETFLDGGTFEKKVDRNENVRIYEMRIMGMMGEPLKTLMIVTTKKKEMTTFIGFRCRGFIENLEPEERKYLPGILNTVNESACFVKFCAKGGKVFAYYDFPSVGTRKEDVKLAVHSLGIFLNCVESGYSEIMKLLDEKRNSREMQDFQYNLCGEDCE